jgi:hypothetical protein
MISEFKGLIGRNTTPTARISSAVISLVILYLIYKNVFPQFNLILFLFLGFHLINQLISSLIENQKYACCKCGKTLKIGSYNFEKHKCKK